MLLKNKRALLVILLFFILISTIFVISNQNEQFENCYNLIPPDFNHAGNEDVTMIFPSCGFALCNERGGLLNSLCVCDEVDDDKILCTWKSTQCPENTVFEERTVEVIKEKNYNVLVIPDEQHYNYKVLLMHLNEKEFQKSGIISVNELKIKLGYEETTNWFKDKSKVILSKNDTGIFIHLTLFRDEYIGIETYFLDVDENSLEKVKQSNKKSILQETGLTQFSQQIQDYTLEKIVPTDQEQESTFLLFKKRKNEQQKRLIKINFEKNEKELNLLQNAQISNSFNIITKETALRDDFLNKDNENMLDDLLKNQENFLSKYRNIINEELGEHVKMSVVVNSEKVTNQEYIEEMQNYASQNENIAVSFEGIDHQILFDYYEHAQINNIYITSENVLILNNLSIFMTKEKIQNNLLNKNNYKKHKLNSFFETTQNTFENIQSDEAEQIISLFENIQNNKNKILINLNNEILELALENEKLTLYLNTQNVEQIKEPITQEKIEFACNTNKDAKGTYYVVKQGDAVWNIANRCFNLKGNTANIINKIKELSNINNKDYDSSFIFPNEKIYLTGQRQYEEIKEEQNDEIEVEELIVYVINKQEFEKSKIKQENLFKTSIKQQTTDKIKTCFLENQETDNCRINNGEWYSSFVSNNLIKGFKGLGYIEIEPNEADEFFLEHGFLCFKNTSKQDLCGEKNQKMCAFGCNQELTPCGEEAICLDYCKKDEDYSLNTWNYESETGRYTLKSEDKEINLKEHEETRNIIQDDERITINEIRITSCTIQENERWHRDLTCDKSTITLDELQNNKHYLYVFAKGINCENNNNDLIIKFEDTHENNDFEISLKDLNEQSYEFICDNSDVMFVFSDFNSLITSPTDVNKFYKGIYNIRIFLRTSWEDSIIENNRLWKASIPGTIDLSEGHIYKEKKQTVSKNNNFQIDGCGEGTIYDRANNLCWEKDAGGYRRMWYDAVLHCERTVKLGEENRQWRLPEIEEWKKLLEFIETNSDLVFSPLDESVRGRDFQGEPANIGTYMNENYGFKHFKDSLYWSNTKKQVGTSTLSHAANLIYGYTIGLLDMNILPVICVSHKENDLKQPSTYVYENWRCDPEWGVIMPFDEDLCWQKKEVSAFWQFGWVESMYRCENKINYGGMTNWEAPSIKDWQNMMAYLDSKYQQDFPRPEITNRHPDFQIHAFNLGTYLSENYGFENLPDTLYWSKDRSTGPNGAYRANLVTGNAYYTSLDANYLSLLCISRRTSPGKSHQYILENSVLIDDYVNREILSDYVNSLR